MERLGGTVEFGRALQSLLEAAGWTISERPLLGGGVLLIASGHGTSVEACADEYAGAIGALFERVMALKVWRQKRAA